MVVKLHFVMKGDKSLKQLFDSLKYDLPLGVSARLTAYGWRRAQDRVSRFSFKNNLYKGIKYQLPKTSTRPIVKGKVYVDNELKDEFFVNEFGRQRKMKVTWSTMNRIPKLKEWYLNKGKGLGVKVPFVLGSVRGGQHYPDPRNRFWIYTYQDMNRRVTYFVDNVLDTILKEHTEVI